MQVILKKRVPKLGHEWDVVNVKPGYARNYLLPQGLADMATPKRIELAKKHMEDRTKKTEEILANAKETGQKLNGVELTFKKKARGEKLYGSITEKDIVEALLKDHKIELNKEMVKMDEHLKTLGEHSVKIHLTEEVDAKILVKVEAEK